MPGWVKQTSQDSMGTRQFLMIVNYNSLQLENNTIRLIFELNTQLASKKDRPMASSHQNCKLISRCLKIITFTVCSLEFISAIKSAWNVANLRCLWRHYNKCVTTFVGLFQLQAVAKLIHWQIENERLEQDLRTR